MPQSNAYAAMNGNNRSECTKIHLCLATMRRQVESERAKNVRLLSVGQCDAMRAWLRAPCYVRFTGVHVCYAVTSALALHDAD